MSQLVFKAPLPPDVTGASLNKIYLQDFIYEEVSQVLEEVKTTTQFQNVRCLTPSSEQLKSFNLKPGVNQISFRVKSTLQGVQFINGYIYLWDWTQKIVISDVDGTITKSDVLGHVLPKFGNDWSQPGIADLYQKISQNGYKILYLTARAIGQAESTKEYIYSIR